MSELWWEEIGVRPVWVEITRRPNDGIGVDLNHHESSHRAYKLLSQPQPDDKVLHWDSKRQQFVGVSTVASAPFDKGQNRWVTLKGFNGLPVNSLTLELVRPYGKQIGRIRESISKTSKSTHFPFQPYGSEGWALLRPALAYLTAAPNELISLLGGIYESMRDGDLSSPTWKDYGLGPALKVQTKSGNARDKQSLRRYVEANEELIVTPSGNVKVPDHTLLEVGYRQHNALQNKVAAWLRSRNLTPVSQRAMDRYPVDIQWEDNHTLCVAEVKSINSSNELSQMRRGIGQVLHYRYLASQQHDSFTVVAALIVPRRPSKEWLAICAEVGIRVGWPGEFNRLRRD
jgi:hypothetical protein